ncbi:MAG TPA: RDD family protein [Cyclobacteriaceae bacterium]|nr:RDD family protein [Cyclobacteriaceae bacterium]HRJ82032.1 RDD family protein [Cyclobacteriaceae bacterium]
MQTVSVRTTQNVVIDYPVASLGDRILAYFIDLFIIIAYFILMIFILIGAEAGSTALIVSTLAIPPFLYHLLFEIFMNGQSPGKRQMKIKVVRLDGTPATIGNYLIRWLIRLIEVDALSGAIALFTIAVSGKGQRLGDIAAGTTVVKLVEQRAVTAKEVFTVSEDTYTPIFQQVVQLSDQDIELIQQALEVNRTTGNSLPVMAVTEKVKHSLGIQTDLPPVKFLYTIVKDYGHITAGK